MALLQTELAFLGHTDSVTSAPVMPSRLLPFARAFRLTIPRWPESDQGPHAGALNDTDDSEMCRQLQHKAMSDQEAGAITKAPNSMLASLSLDNLYLPRTASRNTG